MPDEPKPKISEAKMHEVFNNLIRKEVDRAKGDDEAKASREKFYKNVVDYWTIKEKRRWLQSRNAEIPKNF